MEKLGVEVRTGAMVTDMDAEGVTVGDTRIRARTLIWGAGVAASPLARSLGVSLDRAGRVKMEPTPAWWIWLGIHIAFLIGFHNKVAVMIDWAYTYFTKKCDVRLITGMHANKLPPIYPETPPGVTQERAVRLEEQEAHW